MKNGKRTAALGGSAALALALGGVLVPAGAFAEETNEAPIEGTAYTEVAHNLLAAEGGVEGVGRDGDGNIVVLASKDVDELPASAQDYINSHDNIVVTMVTGPVEAQAKDEVVGGAGYMVDLPDGYVGACSIGFSAWSPEGKPAMISAGHCTDNYAGNHASRTVPSEEPAVGGEGYVPMDDLAELKFSQFGGPGDTNGTDGDATSTDISVWDITNPDVKMLPAVTDWSTASSDDLAAGIATRITSVGEVAVGDQIARSGRTTGYTEGEVFINDLWVPVSGHYVYGFATYANSAPGDSGGPFVRGETAVGILSGGGELEDGTPYSFAADLKTALAITDGYTVMLHLDAPVITTSGTVEAGTAITGTAKANGKVQVTIDGATSEVNVDASGNWTVPGPTEKGTYEITAVAVDGFNKSEAAKGSVTVVAQAIDAPAITSPSAKSVDKVTSVGGTGISGATVTVTGDVTGEATVDADGNWSVPADLSYGKYTVTANQTVDGETSANTSYTFEVVPAAPAITSQKAGDSFGLDKTPGSVTGTGTEGATVTVTLDGKAVGTAVVKDGKWEVKLPADIAAGEHTIAATQTIEDMVSSAASVAFTVKAPVEPTPTPTPTKPGNPGGNLPETGTSDATPLALGALVLLLGGGVLVAARRVRATR